jgi:PiT family inorganic phosphate transporter
MAALLLGCTLLLAFANGANDNLKGVATLHGCGGVDYRRALWLGTLSVAAGSLLSVFVAGALVEAFTAKGLVPDALLDVRFLTAVAAAAAATCLCLHREAAPALAPAEGAAWLSGSASTLRVQTGTADSCPVHADVALSRPQLERAVDVGHFASATLVGFARGLNDTPKILGLLVGAAVVAPVTGALWIAAAMALGGLVAARRVTHTLARKITPMTPGEGLAGNLATSLLVVGASRFGVPVSTTHVSTGGIFGIGLSNGELRRGAAAQVLAAWVTTLPVAAGLAAGAMALLAS